MFHDIPQQMIDRMRYLEEIDARDRNDGTPRMERLRQIPPETGRFLALLAASAPDGDWIEIGTSAGYSTLWLALAARSVGRRLTTYEILPEKAKLARETFHVSGVEDVINLVEGNALDYIPSHASIGFCFLDAEKEVYGTCYEAIVPKLASGGLIVADNAINHREALQPMLERALHDARVDALIVPIGKGELICRKL